MRFAFALAFSPGRPFCAQALRPKHNKQRNQPGSPACLSVDNLTQVSPHVLDDQRLAPMSALWWGNASHLGGR